MTLGIGRGDSALAHLGRAPARPGWFETYVQQLQAYLSGAQVPFNDFGIPEAAAPPAQRLSLANTPEASTIRGAGNLPKVLVEVAATGPRVIGIAARHADRVMLAVGADPKRVVWGIETARAAAGGTGRDPDSLGFGAYVNVVCHESAAEGREIGRGSTGLFARFSAMYGKVPARPMRGRRRSFGGCTTAMTWTPTATKADGRPPRLRTISWTATPSSGRRVTAPTGLRRLGISG